MEQTKNTLTRDRQKMANFRDQAAFVFLTGIMPTHLRSEASRKLVDACQVVQGNTCCGAWRKAFDLKPEVIAALDLINHPMVRAVEALVSEGWFIQSSRGINARRPFAKIFLKRDDKRRAVQRDGSILFDWLDQG
jgi:hypothetical protein